MLRLWGLLKMSLASTSVFAAHHAVLTKEILAYVGNYIKAQGLGVFKAESLHQMNQPFSMTVAELLMFGAGVFPETTDFIEIDYSELSLAG